MTALVFGEAPPVVDVCDECGHVEVAHREDPIIGCLGHPGCGCKGWWLNPDPWTPAECEHRPLHQAGRECYDAIVAEADHLEREAEYLEDDASEKRGAADELREQAIVLDRRLKTR